MTALAVHGDPDGFDEDAWGKSGFHPTMRRPIPSMQCLAPLRNGPRAGERCTNRALLGASVCISHGGHLPSVKAKSVAIVEAARLRLVDSSDEAVDWLLDLGRNASSEAVRLGAARDVLDRAGIRGGSEVEVTVNTGESPADVLRERLGKLQERSRLGQAALAHVIEGEALTEDDMVPITEPAPEREESHD